VIGHKYLLIIFFLDLMSDDKLETVVPSIGADDSTRQMTLTNSIRRTFNICDILAKPSSFIDNHTCQIQQFKFLIEDSISDCNVSGKEMFS
jgi:hypothetical protein